MKKSKLLETIDHLLFFIEKLIPNYMDNKEDNSISGGNVAVCIIDENGQIYGRMYGKDKIRQRYFYQIAWAKASQVWITNMPTGEFEKLVFNGDIDDKKFGIKRQDFVGWHGGQLLKLDGVKLTIGFSGFRAENDLEIVDIAVNEISNA